jgi:predicted transcriptional regulator
MPSRPYKDLVIYGCFVLNRLVSELGIHLEQEGLEGKLDGILATKVAFLTKEQIKREIRSNHYMTTKVIEALAEQGLVRVESEEGRYRIHPTRDGVLHVRRYNEFYRRVYLEQIRDHYRYRPPPGPLRE